MVVPSRALKVTPDPILCSSNTTLHPPPRVHHAPSDPCSYFSQIRTLHLDGAALLRVSVRTSPFGAPSQPRSRSSLMWLSHNRASVLCALSSGAHGTHTRSLRAVFRAQAEPSTTVAALGAASQHKVYLQEQLTALRGAYTRWSVDRELGRTNEIVTSPKMRTRALVLCRLCNGAGSSRTRKLHHPACALGRFSC